MRAFGGTRDESATLYAAAGALMLGGPVWQALYSSFYPFSRAEATVVPLAAALIGAGYAVGMRAIGGIVGSLGFGVLLLLFADLQFDLQRWVPMWLVAAMCIGLALLLVAHRAAITSLALGALYAASLVRAPLAPAPTHVSTTRPARAHAPPLLVHIILDEQWGIGGIRAIGDTATAAFLTDFYRTRGFELYDAAYSRYEYTVTSIPNMLSLGERPSFNLGTQTKPYWRSLRDVPYFARLRELGYDVHVFQSTYLDYCHSRVPVASCHVEYGDAVRNIAFLDGRATTRARWVVRYVLLTRSHLYEKLHLDDEAWGHAVIGGAISGARQLTNEIASRPDSGQALFAHLLMPHRPIDVDAECRIRADATDRLFLNHPAQPTDSAWRGALRMVSGQIRCAHRVIDGVIAAIDRTVGRDGAIVIIQGDHGARIQPRKHEGVTLAQYSGQQLDLAFTTLLAVRRPHVEAATYLAPVPVQEFVWAMARTGFSGAMPTTWQHYVRRERRDGEPRDTMRTLGPREMIWAAR